MDKYNYALVRGVADSYDQCIRSGTETIDVALAREQHHKYREALLSLGLRVIYVDPDERYPDCCFAEDPALVVGDTAFIARMGVESRSGEETRFRVLLSRRKVTVEIEPPGTLEGGDVLRIDKQLFIGLSQRTNAAAIDQLRHHLGPEGYEIVSVKTKDLVHLKSDVAYIGGGHIVMRRGRFDEAVFDGYEKIVIPEEEGYAANCLAANGTVLVSAGYPETKWLIEAADFPTIPIEMSEFRKGEGALTCLSILF